MLRRHTIQGLLLTALLAALALLVHGMPVDAQQGAGVSTWSVQPATPDGPDHGRARFEYEAVEPGATLSDYVYVRNGGAADLTLEVYASDAVNTAGGGFDLLPAGESPVDVGAWVRLDQATVNIPAGEAMVIPFTIAVPSNATPGDHVGGIVASLAGRASDADGTRVNVHLRVGTRIYLRVGGALAPQLTIEGLQARYAGSLSPLRLGDLHLTYTVRNSGNVRLSGGQTLEVLAPLGIAGQRRELDFLPEILPGSEYVVELVIADVIPTLRSRARLTIEPRGPDGAPVAGLSAVAAAASIWAVPWVHLAALGVAAGLIAYAPRSAWARRRRSTRPLPTSAEIRERLNRDHANALLEIGRGLGGQPEAARAVVVGLDRQRIDLVVMVRDEPVPVQLRWREPIASEPSVHAEIERMRAESVELLQTGTHANPHI